MASANSASNRDWGKVCLNKQLLSRRRIICCFMPSLPRGLKICPLKKNEISKLMYCKKWQHFFKSPRKEISRELPDAAFQARQTLRLTCSNFHFSWFTVISPPTKSPQSLLTEDQTRSQTITPVYQWIVMPWILAPDFPIYEGCTIGGESPSWWRDDRKAKKVQVLACKHYCLQHQAILVKFLFLVGFCKLRFYLKSFINYLL